MVTVSTCDAFRLIALIRILIFGARSWALALMHDDLSKEADKNCDQLFAVRSTAVWFELELDT